MTRLLSLLFAVAQLVMPAASAVADGLASTGAAPVGHVESRTSSSCAVVHPPDCGVCRYLWTHCASATAELPPILRRARPHVTTSVVLAGSRPAVMQPPERAPPVNG